jgi:hypothetical protein
MNYDYDLIRDLIVEKDPDIKREDIIFDYLYIEKYSNIIIDGEWLVIPYTIKIIKFIYGMEKEFTYSKNITYSLLDYEIRLKEKIRDDKLGELGI